MTPPEAHPSDELQLLLEGLLPADRRGAVEAHLAACERCRRELEAIRWARSAVRRAPAEADLPPQLAVRIGTSLDAEDRAARRRRQLRWVVPVSLAAAAVVTLVLLRQPAPPDRDMVQVASSDFDRYRSGALTLQLATAEPARLESFFSERVPGIRTRVFDFGMMGYALAGGRVHRFAGRESAMFTYRSAAGTAMVCVMYPGTLAELPAGAEQREHNGIRFRIYRRGALTLVFWEEGEIVCVLASEGAPEEVVQFAYAKAVKV